LPFAPGRLEVGYEVRNTGNVRLGARGSVEVRGPFGLARTMSEAGPVDELLPGEAVSREVSMKAQGLSRITGSLILTPTVVGEDDLEPPDRTGDTFTLAAVSWTDLAVIVLVLLVILALLLGRRRRRGQRKVAPAEVRPGPARPTDRQALG
jgi:hypothetical protein